MKTSWISAGVSSFIATYLIKDTIDEIYYIDIKDQHIDSIRFIKDCEKVLNKKINILRSELKSVENAINMYGVIKLPSGYAPCTNLLKKRVRKEQFEMLHQNEDITYVWGFDCTEKNRAYRLYESMPNYKHEFPLIDNNLTKEDCHAILKRLNIRRPLMYDLGYNNNNCIGCIKGGMGYWNKIRKDFPQVYKSRAEMERKIEHSILKEYYLDELPENKGNQTEEIMEDCGIFCEIALSKTN